MLTDKLDWDRAAEEYGRKARQEKDNCLEDLGDSFCTSLGPLKDRSILDLGCGPGVLAEKIRRKGGRVTGLDISGNLILQAVRHSPQSVFLQHDLSRGLPDMKENFSLAIAHMVLMDLPRIDRLLNDLHKTLKPEGRLVFTLPHPVFFNQKRGHDQASDGPVKMIRSYLAHSIIRVETFGGHNHYHRPLSFYFSELKQAGFLVAELIEPPHKMHRRNPLASWYLDFPVYCLITAIPA